MEKQHAATIRNTNKGSDFKVLFNPTKYQLNESNEFKEVPVPGRHAPPIQFVRGVGSTLSMQLLFDTYDPISPNDVKQGSDVRDYTKQVLDLLEVDPDTHAPPLCQFSWGSFSFKGVLQSANQHFTLFNAEGTPLRATIDVTFKEAGQVTPEGQRHSADVTKQHVVHRGETLSGIATQHYEDPTFWREIARANSLDDPLSIEPGLVLVIPALPAGGASADGLAAARLSA